jgi:cell division protein FtsB
LGNKIFSIPLITSNNHVKYGQNHFAKIIFKNGLKGVFMNNDNQTKNFKRIIIILVLLLFGLGAYTLILFQESQANQKDLQEQKMAIAQELGDLKGTYDALLKDYQLQDQELIEARSRIAQLLDSVESAKPSMAIIKRYRIEIARLKEERTMLFARADSLIQVTQSLSFKVDSTLVVLDQTRLEREGLRQKNDDLERVLEKGSRLQIIDFSSNAVIVRRSGKIVDTKRASRADKIRACFTITPNAVAVPGERNLYLQVINPKNNLIGSRMTLEQGQERLYYSATTQVDFQQEEVDVCIMVGAQEEDLVSGRYILNLYQDSTRLATTTMLLK